jgi:hypothetical protein
MQARVEAVQSMEARLVAAERRLERMSQVHKRNADIAWLCKSTL